MIKIIANSLMLSALLFTNTVCANNEATPAKIEVLINIFSLDDAIETNIADILQHSNMQSSTVFYTKAGESKILDVGKGDQKQAGKFTMNLKVNSLATKYDINFQLINGDEVAIPGVSSYDIGDDLVFSAKINGSSKLIKVVTHVIDENNGSPTAKSMLKLSKKLVLEDSSQKYFEEDNFWKTDPRRYRRMSKGKFIANDSYYYLTNTDQDRAIRGVIELDSPQLFHIPKTVFNMGVNNFSLKDNQFTFVILPGKTVLIGRWAVELNLTIKKALFLSAAEVEDLKNK